MGRPREFDLDQALSAARDQFWLHGYAATSIDDLLDVTGLGKGSFYGAFGDKRKLFLRVLNEYAAGRLAATRKAHRGAPRAIDALRDLLEPDFRPRGCFLVNCTFELAPEDAEVSKLARETFDTFEEIFAETVRRAVAEGDLPSSTHPRELATTLLAVMQGQESLARTGLNRVALRNIGRKAALALLGVAEASKKTGSRTRHRGC